jgi:hypothetical protein
MTVLLRFGGVLLRRLQVGCWVRYFVDDKWFHFSDSFMKGIRRSYPSIKVRSGQLGGFTM